MQNRIARRWWRIPVLLFVTLLLGLLMLFIPWNTSELGSHPHPVQNYATALQRIEALRAPDSAAMNPVCRVQLLTQGRQVERVIILVHGYTSCPQQFMELGKRFYDLGYNVLIAPMPHHGLRDRMTESHAHLTAEELATYADEVVDIAQGLGDTVVMAGLSVGGVVTAFAAENRSDIDLAVLISPAFSYKPIPNAVRAVAMNAFNLLPNAYVWWNEAKKQQGGVPHGYPRYAQRALAQSLRLSYAARDDKPKARKILVITNPNDDAVNNELTYQVITQWRKQGLNLETYEFPAALKLPHDLIEPLAPEGNMELVYGKLVELVNNSFKN